jgi:hypothetical protein
MEQSELLTHTKMDSNDIASFLDPDDNCEQLQINSKDEHDKVGLASDQQSRLRLNGHGELQSDEDGKAMQEHVENQLARVPEALESQEGTTSLLGPMSKDLLQTLQTDVNVCAKRNTGPLTIFDLPDELLMHIFDYVRGYPITTRRFRPLLKISDIKSVRLTCKRFCGASSHLFVHFLGLGVDQESLDLLNDASSHPIISNGIKCIELSLCFYVAEMAQDIDKFSSESLDNLMNIVYSWRDPLSFIYGENLEENQKASRAMIELKNILQSWKLFLWGSPDDPIDNTTSLTARLHKGIEQESSGHLLLLRNAHEHYQYRFSEQQELLKEYTFVEAVATAFTRMPMARRLELHDHGMQYARRNIPFQRVKSWIDGTTNHAELIRHMVNPVR